MIHNSKFISLNSWVIMWVFFVAIQRSCLLLRVHLMLPGALVTFLLSWHRTAGSSTPKCLKRLWLCRASFSEVGSASGSDPGVRCWLSQCPARVGLSAAILCSHQENLKIRDSGLSSRMWGSISQTFQNQGARSMPS